MAKIRVTKEFTFEMAHALWNYDGPCRNIHGHSYKLFVTIIGDTIEDKNHVKQGMVMDFTDLKQLVKEHIVDYFDHSVVINAGADKPEIQKVKQMFEKLYIVNYQPTCENLVTHMAALLVDKLPDHVQLYSMKLVETATSYAEWFASDND